MFLRGRVLLLCCSVVSWCCMWLSLFYMCVCVLVFVCVFCDLCECFWGVFCLRCFRVYLFVCLCYGVIVFLCVDCVVVCISLLSLFV